MLARALLFVTAGIVLSGCVDSERLRSDLGGPAAAEPAQDPSKQTLASKVLGAIAVGPVSPNLNSKLHSFLRCSINERHGFFTAAALTVAICLLIFGSLKISSCIFCASANLS